MKNTNILANPGLDQETKTIICRIRSLREERSFSQQKVAEYLGTSQTMYARYERAANELPIHHLIKLCKLYDVSSDYIIGLTDKK